MNVNYKGDMITLFMHNKYSMVRKRQKSSKWPTCKILHLFLSFKLQIRWVAHIQISSDTAFMIWILMFKIIRKEITRSLCVV